MKKAITKDILLKRARSSINKFGGTYKAPWQWEHEGMPKETVAKMVANCPSEEHDVLGTTYRVDLHCVSEKAIEEIASTHLAQLLEEGRAKAKRKAPELASASSQAAAVGGQSATEAPLPESTGEAQGPSSSSSSSTSSSSDKKKKKKKSKKDKKDKKDKKRSPQGEEKRRQGQGRSAKAEARAGELEESRGRASQSQERVKEAMARDAAGGRQDLGESECRNRGVGEHCGCPRIQRGASNSQGHSEQDAEATPKVQGRCASGGEQRAANAIDVHCARLFQCSQDSDVSQQRVWVVARHRC